MGGGGGKGEELAHPMWCQVNKIVRLVPQFLASYADCILKAIKQQKLHWLDQSNCASVAHFVRSLAASQKIPGLIPAWSRIELWATFIATPFVDRDTKPLV